MNDLRAALTFFFTVTFVASPLVTDPFMGFRADQLPLPQIDPAVQPAGYAFAIWGLIYGWLIVSAIFGLAVRAYDADWDRARVPLIVSLAIGTPWLWIANTSAIWATVTIAIMAATAIAALLLTPRTDRWLLRVPVALYAGWLTAASCVSIAVTLSGYGILLGPQGWAYVMIGVGLLVAMAVQARRGAAPEYGLAVIWALVAIVVANYHGSGIAAVGLFAGAGAVVLALATARAAAKARIA